MARFASIVVDERGRVESYHRVRPYDEADLFRRSATGDVAEGNAVGERFFPPRSVREPLRPFASALGVRGGADRRCALPRPVAEHLC